MQTWEYKTVFRRRGSRSVETGQTGLLAAHYENYEVGDKWDPDLKFLDEFGLEGWELVTVVTRSSFMGGHKLGEISDDYAGFTTDEHWVFKRPKS